MRRAYYRFVRLQRYRTLFTFLEPELNEHEVIASTTNQSEGRVNAAIKHVILDHRGLFEPHMRRACEWVVYMLFSYPDPEAFITPE